MLHFDLFSSLNLYETCDYINLEIENLSRIVLYAATTVWLCDIIALVGKVVASMHATLPFKFRARMYCHSDSWTPGNSCNTDIELLLLLLKNK